MTRFSIIAALMATLADNLRTVASPERTATTELDDLYGEAPYYRPDNSFRVPDSAWYRSERDLAAGGSAAALVDLSVHGLVPALSAHTNVLKAGAQQLRIIKSNIGFPRVATLPTGYWLANEFSAIPESSPIIGQALSSPRMLGAFVEVPRDLLLQSAAESVVKNTLLQAAGVAADRAALCGTGDQGQPQGIARTPEVPTITGASYGLSTAIAMESAVNVAGAGANPETCAWFTDTTRAALLKQRARFSNQDHPLWRGPIAAGEMEGQRAFGTENAPASTVVYGDFSYLSFVQWQPAIISVDQYTKFRAAVIGIRLLLPMDIVILHPGAFVVATNVT